MKGIPGTKYISYRKHLDVYEIIKVINRKTEYFGRYHSLEDAIKWRDFFIENEWNTDLRLIGTPNKNIKFNHGKYLIYKNIDGKEFSFGSFDNYEDAEKRVNEIRLIGWEKVIFNNERLLETTVKNIIKLPNGKYQVRKMIDGKQYYFGVYNNYEDAVEEVKFLRKCNWNYDAIDSIDESNDGVHFVDKTKMLKRTYSPKSGNDEYWARYWMSYYRKPKEGCSHE